MEFKQYLEESEYLIWEQCNENRLLDILKGSFDIVKGAAQTGAGIMTVGDEALAKMVGDGQKGRMRKGFQGITKGVGSAAGGVKKIVVGDKNIKPQAALVKQTTPAKQATQVTSIKQAAPKSPKKPNPLWQKLVAQYAAAKTQEEKRKLQSQLAQADPAAYQQSLKAALPRKRPATDPAGRLRSGRPRKII
jgi:hypothetical protein